MSTQYFSSVVFSRLQARPFFSRLSSFPATDTQIDRQTDKWVRRKLGWSHSHCFFFLTCSISRPNNSQLPTDVSELHKVPRLTEFEALESWNVRLGCLSLSLFPLSSINTEFECTLHHLFLPSSLFFLLSSTSFSISIFRLPLLFPCMLQLNARLTAASLAAKCVGLRTEHS